MSDNFQAHAEQTRSIPTIFIAVKLNFHKSDNSLISETNLIDGLAEVNRRGNQIFHKAILSWATRELKVSCDSRFRNGIFFSRNFFLSLAKPLTAVYDFVIELSPHLCNRINGSKYTRLKCLSKRQIQFNTPRSRFDLIRL